MLVKYTVGAQLHETVNIVDYGKKLETNQGVYKRKLPQQTINIKPLNGITKE